MEKDAIKRILRYQALMKDLPEAEIDQIIESIEEKRFEIGETLINEGEFSTEIYFILSGKVELLHSDDKKENQFSLGELSGGVAVGEMSFLQNYPRSCTVKAQTPTSVLILSKQKLQAQGAPGAQVINSIILNIAKIAVEKVRETNKKYVKSLQGFQTKIDEMKVDTQAPDSFFT
jgi:CRP-like cAMP-binding protein